MNKMIKFVLLMFSLLAVSALHAADLHRQFKLATADAVVYATAREFDAELLTCDAHFENLPSVIFIRNEGR